jgi:CHAD domain-containing protein
MATDLEHTTDEPGHPAAASIDDSGKWVEVEAPECLAAPVAYRALEARLGYVAQRLPLAAYEYEDDIEHVHQLRVGCRRAAAAVRAFRSLTKKKPRRLKKWLRRIRQAAGPARDTDVLIEHLKKRGGSGPHFDDLVSRVQRQRDDAQQALVELNAAAASGKFQKHIDACLRSLQHNRVDKRALTFRELAVPPLKAAAEEFIEIASARETSNPRLHKLRIAGKRLRYSIELFQGAFDPSLRDDVYPQIKEAQTRLGTLNDRAATQLRFQRWLADMPADDQAAYLAKWIVTEHEAADSIRAEFLAWWSEDRMAGLEDQLRTLLGTRPDPAIQG